MVATAAARAAAEADVSPHLIPFAPALSLIRAHVAADTCCPHCGRRPVTANAQVSGLTAILALPRHREGRKRTSGRTAAGRRNGHTEDVTYVIEIVSSNLPGIGQQAA